MQARALTQRSLCLTDKALLFPLAEMFDCLVISAQVGSVFRLIQIVVLALPSTCAVTLISSAEWLHLLSYMILWWFVLFNTDIT